MCSHADMNGADAMDEDGALPPAAATQPAELNFDADITPEEMQMMAGMGIPFGFDTTQVLLLPPCCCHILGRILFMHRAASSLQHYTTLCWPPGRSRVHFVTSSA